MRLSLCALFLVAGCAVPKATKPTPPPLPPLPALSLLAPKPLLLSHLSTNTVPWIYPASINPSNFCWTLQSSANLVDWVDLPGACVTDPLYGFATNGAGFWRLKGSE